jgi:hypothetical protein
MPHAGRETSRGCARRASGQATGVAWLDDNADARGAIVQADVVLV